MKQKIVVFLAVGLMLILAVIVIGDFYVAIIEKRPPDESVINLLQSALTGIIGIIAGFVAGKHSNEE